MSGVTVGTRLEHLERLRRRIDLELAAERRRVALTPEAPPARRDTYVDDELNAAELLDKHWLTAKTVKRWALAQGLIPEVKRGRVPRHLVVAYLEAVRP